MDVVEAISADLAIVLEWLEGEYEEGGEDFWYNLGIIGRALDVGDLWIIRRAGEVAVFQVGTYTADRQRPRGSSPPGIR